LLQWLDSLPLVMGELEGSQRTVVRLSFWP
jgi:hypothetical protein